MSYRMDKPNFLEFWVKMAKMTLKVKVNGPYFQYQPRVSQDACLVQIWWFQLKSVTSYRADKVKFTDGQTDGQTQATTIPLRPERLRGKIYQISTNDGSIFPEKAISVDFKCTHHQILLKKVSKFNGLITKNQWGIDTTIVNFRDKMWDIRDEKRLADWLYETWHLLDYYIETETKKTVSQVY